MTTLVRALRPFVCAVQFLTCIPVSLRDAPSAGDLRWAAAYYPLVGLLIGLGAVAVYKAAAALLPASSVAIVLVLLFLVAVTGALHEDGLADWADGFMGARERDRVLEIMRDSRIGTFGALAVIFALLLKYTLLTSLGERELVGGLIVAPALSRWLVLPLAMGARPARPAGLGSTFAGQIGLAQVLIAAIPVLLVGAWLFQVSFLALAAGAAGTVAFFGWYCHHRIGGVTGDCLGAAIQLAELATYLLVAVLAA
jgi:adenosylcobinamide-GDP ribazoletransferase